jgi:hypothetical protein
MRKALRGVYKKKKNKKEGKKESSLGKPTHAKFPPGVIGPLSPLRQTPVHVIRETD